MSKITANQLSTGANSATVLTSEATASTTYADLTTTTDSVTVTIGTNGLALVALCVDLLSNSGPNYNLVSFAASGANTIAASDNNALIFLPTTVTQEVTSSWVKVLTGLSPGSTTFKIKYRVVGGTGTFKNRIISVVPL